MDLKDSDTQSISSWVGIEDAKRQEDTQSCASWMDLQDSDTHSISSWVHLSEHPNDTEDWTSFSECGSLQLQSWAPVDGNEEVESESGKTKETTLDGWKGKQAWLNDPKVFNPSFAEVVRNCLPPKINPDLVSSALSTTDRTPGIHIIRFNRPKKVTFASKLGARRRNCRVSPKIAQSARAFPRAVGYKLPPIDEHDYFEEEESDTDVEVELQSVLQPNAA